MSDNESTELETVETIENYDEVREELDGREVTLVYDSVHTDGNVEFSGGLEVRGEADFSVVGDGSRNVWYGRVNSAAGNQPRVGQFVRLEVHAPEGEDEDSEDTESETVELSWTGKTRDSVESNLFTLLEMGDVSRETVDAFDRHSQKVVFEDGDAARDALDEMEYIADMGHPGIHGPTLQKKIQALREKLPEGEDDSEDASEDGDVETDGGVDVDALAELDTGDELTFQIDHETTGQVRELTGTVADHPYMDAHDDWMVVLTDVTRGNIRVAGGSPGSDSGHVIIYRDGSVESRPNANRQIHIGDIRAVVTPITTEDEDTPEPVTDGGVDVETDSEDGAIDALRRELAASSDEYPDDPADISDEDVFQSARHDNTDADGNLIIRFHADRSGSSVTFTPDPDRLFRDFYAPTSILMEYYGLTEGVSAALTAFADAVNSRTVPDARVGVLFVDEDSGRVTGAEFHEHAFEFLSDVDPDALEQDMADAANAAGDGDE